MQKSLSETKTLKDGGGKELNLVKLPQEIVRTDIWRMLRQIKLVKK